MEAVRKTVVEVLILGLIAVALALTVNAVRGSGSVKLTKNYFDKGFGRVRERAKGPAPLFDLVRPRKSAPPSAEDVGRGEEARQTRGVSGLMTRPTGTPPVDRHPGHPYQEVSFEEVVEIFNDPNAGIGAYIFVDARNDAAYENGHIPGAIQADHYRLVDYIDTLLDCAESAEKIIIYCNGGDCEDSIFLCGDLLDFEIPYERLYLYPGGWKEWTARNMPVVKEHAGEESEE